MLTKEELPECAAAATVQVIGSTDSLRAMEADGIVDRTVYAEVPPRVEYALNELGETLRPIIKAMEEWGVGYQERVRVKG